MSEAQVGSYVVKLTNRCGTQASVAVDIQLEQLLESEFTSTPQRNGNKEIALQHNQSFQLTVAVDDSEATYQWYRNGQPISGAEQAQYAANGQHPQDTGMYYCLITGRCGDELRSDSARVLIEPPTTAVEGVTATASVQLLPSYPNPFANTTRIEFVVATPLQVQLVIVDVNGRQVAQLADQWYAAGQHTVVCNADERSLTSGIYYAVLRTPRGQQVQRLVVVQ